VKLVKPHQTVEETVLVVEIKSVRQLVENLCLTVKKTVELVVIEFVISRPKILVSALKIVDIVETVFVMLIKERTKFLVRQIVVPVYVEMVDVLLENHHKLVQLIASHRIPIPTMSKLF